MSAPLTSSPSSTTAPSPATPESRPGLVRALWVRFGHLVRELGKFGVIGAVSYVIDTTIFNLLLTSLGPFFATCVSTTVAATLAFVGNRFWTWRDRERTKLHREYLLYFGFNVVGLVIALACLWVSHSGLGHFWPAIFHGRIADNISKGLVGAALGTLFRFWSYRRYVFPDTKAPVPAPREAPVP
jgi:putative flippase GtrA